jgi:hypothetical protein
VAVVQGRPVAVLVAWALLGGLIGGGAGQGANRPLPLDSMASLGRTLQAWETVR